MNAVGGMIRLNKETWLVVDTAVYCRWYDKVKQEDLARCLQVYTVGGMIRSNMKTWLVVDTGVYCRWYDKVNREHLARC